MSDLRTILISGASGKIGGVLTRFFLKKGDKVIAIAKTTGSLDRLAADNQQGFKENRLFTFPLNLMSEHADKELTDFLDAKQLNPTSLINNARAIDNIKLGENACVKPLNFLNEFHLGVVSAYQLVMNLANRGSLESVVNISSMYGVVVPNLKLYDSRAFCSPIHYGVAKSALIHLTKELAVRLASQGIRVNSVSFGGVSGRVDFDFEQRYRRLCPSDRMLKEADLAGPVDFLISSAASGTTGHNLIVDGGWTAW